MLQIRRGLGVELFYLSRGVDTWLRWFQAISELNVKPKFWRDLLTDKPFTRKDIIHLQDPLNFQNKVVAHFEHIKKDLSVEEARGDEGSSLRHVSEDTQRVLDTLGTSSAKAAFDSGGGGKAVEARRILAAAKSEEANKSDKEAKTGGPGEGSRPENWILQAPKRERVVKFKPGANTWDTDDYINPEEESNKRKRSRRSLQETIANPTSFDPNGNKPNPKEAYEPNVKYESSVETTGACGAIAIPAKQSVPFVSTFRFRILENSTAQVEQMINLASEINNMYVPQEECRDRLRQL